jgi:hypothetical protein
VELLSFVKQRIHNGGLKCALISSEWWWNVIGAYIPPLETNGDTLNYVDETVWYHGTKDP